MKKSKDKSILVLVIGYIASILLGILVATPLGWYDNEVQAWTEIEMTVFNKKAFIVAAIIALIGIGITTATAIRLCDNTPAEKPQSLLDD